MPSGRRQSRARHQPAHRRRFSPSTDCYDCPSRNLDAIHQHSHRRAWTRRLPTHLLSALLIANSTGPGHSPICSTCHDEYLRRTTGYAYKEGSPDGYGNTQSGLSIISNAIGGEMIHRNIVENSAIPAYAIISITTSTKAVGTTTGYAHIAV